MLLSMMCQQKKLFGTWNVNIGKKALKQGLKLKTKSLKDQKSKEKGLKLKGDIFRGKTYLSL